MQPAGLTDGQAKPQSIQPSFLFDPVTSPWLAVFWCWQFFWFSQRWKIIACGVVAGVVCVFVASIPTPVPRQNLGSGAYFKACVKLYVILIKMEGSRVNWQSPTTASAKWHREKWKSRNLSILPICKSAKGRVTLAMCTYPAWGKSRMLFIFLLL